MHYTRSVLLFSNSVQVPWKVARFYVGGLFLQKVHCGRGGKQAAARKQAAFEGTLVLLLLRTAFIKCVTFMMTNDICQASTIMFFGRFQAVVGILTILF